MSRAVHAAQAVYAFAARLLPHRFREQYLADVLADSRTLFAAAFRRAGGPGVATTLIRALIDLAWRIPIEHLEQRRARRRSHDPESRAFRQGGGPMTGWREVQQALRALARRPGFSGVIALTMALGMGATVTMFAVVYGVLVRPLPYPESERIVLIRHHAPGLDIPNLESSPGTIRLYRELARSYQELAATSGASGTLTGREEPAQVDAGSVTPSLFSLLRTPPAVGRAFSEEDAVDGAPAVAVLTDRGWRTHFGADPQVLGSSIRLDGVLHEVVGIMPPGWRYPSEDERPVAILTPYHLDADGPFGAFGTTLLARLRDGVSVEAAQREVDALQARLPEVAEGVTGPFLERAGWHATVATLHERVVGEARAGLWIVFGTVAIVFCIALANVANLFLVRAESRRREIAIRTVLGAGRRRLLVGFLTESLILGALGSIGAVALAAVGTRLLGAYGPATLPRLGEIGIGFPGLAFAAALALVAGLLFGWLPALRSLGGSLATLTREGGSGTTIGRARHRTRNLLVVGQVALAVVLLVGSGLMLRSFDRLRSVDPGFDPDGVLLVGVRYGEPADRAVAASFYERLLERVAALPGVATAGAVGSPPVLVGPNQSSSFAIDGVIAAEDDLPPVSWFTAITPGFFEALRIPLRSGRPITPLDHHGAPSVVWVNETFASRYLDGEPLGQRITFQDEAEWAEIVGVVGNTRSFGLEEPLRPVAYFPMDVPGPDAAALDQMTLVIRAAGSLPTLVGPIRAVVRELAPTVPLTTTITMQGAIAGSMIRTSFVMTLLVVSGAISLLLGTVGIYGVIAYIVSQRTREIGVRMALGARAADVRGMVVREGLRMTAGGVALGLVGAFAVTRLMASVLFEVSARDPVTFAAVPILLTAIGVLASYVPARRASAISPTEALKQE